MSDDRRLILASEVTPEPVSWLWSNRIPLGGITTIESDGGTGKTTIITDLAARLTTGRPMPITGEVVGPVGAVLLQAEDLLESTTRPALEAAGADLTRTMVFDKRRFAEDPLLLPKDVPVIASAIDEVQAKIVVFDPLPSFLVSGSNSEHCVRNSLRRLGAMAEEKGVAVVVVRHLTKNRWANPKYRGGGSVSIINVARSALMIVDPPQGEDPFEHVLVLSKSNMGTAAPLRYRTVMDHGVIKVEWLGECLCSAGELLESSDNRFESSQLEEACYVLYSILAGKDGKPAKDVLKEASDALVSARTLKRAKKRLGVRSFRKANNGGEGPWEWVWKLPADHAVLRPYKERSLREQPQHDTDGRQVPLLIQPSETVCRAEQDMDSEKTNDGNGEVVLASSDRSWGAEEELFVPPPDGAQPRADLRQRWDE